jgi:hypothetical protein
MKLLQEDPAETTRDILYFISRQLANNSIPALPRIEYEAPQYAVVVNALLFTSLSCSLIAALLAVLALQWVANYDMGLNTSSARKRALQRHTRWTGIEKWKMGEIIASLPLLIFVSLFLFFMGVAVWLWHINRAISSIVIGGIGIGYLVYSVTNIISIVKLDAPFRTAVSKGLAPLIRRAAVWTRLLVQELPSRILKENEDWPRIRWSRIREIWNSTYSRTAVPPQNFTKYEEMVVEEKDETALESLVWLANSIEITPASWLLLLALTKEVTELPGELLLTNKKIDQAPWDSIFTELCSPYFSRRSIDEYPQEDVKVIRDICKSFSMISSGVTSPALSGFFGAIESEDPQTYAAIQLLRCRQLGWGPHWLVLALRKAYRSISLMDDNTFHFILLLIEQAWPNLTEYTSGILSDLIIACTNHCDNTGGPHPIPMGSLHVILQLIARQDDDALELNNQKEQSDIIGRYISVVRRMIEGTDKQIGYQIHRAIQNQLLVHISLVDFSLPSCINDLAASLELLLYLIGCRPLALIDEERDKFIHILAKIHAENRDQLMNTNIVEESLLNGLQYGYGTGDQPFDRWTCLVLAINEYLESGSIQSQQDRSNILRMMLTNPPNRGLYNPETSLQDILIRIKDPSIALWLAEYCPNDWQFEALINPNLNAWSASVEEAVSLVLIFRMDLISSELYISFLRTMIVDGPPASQRTAINFFRYCFQHDMNNLEEVIRLIFTMSQYFINLFSRFGCRCYQHQFSKGSSNTTRKVITLR